MPKRMSTGKRYEVNFYFFIFFKVKEAAQEREKKSLLIITPIKKFRNGQKRGQFQEERCLDTLLLKEMHKLAGKVTCFMSLRGDSPQHPPPAPPPQVTCVFPFTAWIWIIVAAVMVHSIRSNVG